MIIPTKVLFIKLGEKGLFETDCIENEQTIKLSYKEISHELCINDKWDEVEELIKEKYKTNQAATTSHRNQIKKFYTEPASTMWITFYDGKLWYCFAKPEISYDTNSRTKSRKTINGWSSVDSKNNTLFIQALSGKLTKVQGFRGAICDVSEKDYLINKINNTQSPAVEKVENNLAALKNSIETLIKNLSPQDFEVFVDLIFRNSGWSRVGLLGKTIKTIDIELIAPVTGERAIVQVKSQSDLKLFQEYKERLDIPEYDHIFYVTHSPNKQLQKYIESTLDDKIKIWDAKKLANFCINSGLIDWLISTTG
ncbi:restriction endonuclease [uncultured Tolumonas sp.]|uniref:restriction endonuclease n=1 Tax=uncultured Tolumonas sp. TaxID=263765 RepID=UPI002A0A9AA5|nr:hypothetical protein [uncultured Tolumonas sp.]